MQSAADPGALPLPPAELLNGASLFVDFDGTLVELIDRPDEVVADEPLRALLSRLAARVDGRLAIVSGRSIAQLDAMLGPVARGIALAGSHGSEHRWGDMRAQPVRPGALDRAAERFQAFAVRHPGVLVEIKSFGVALHYRQAPTAEKEARALAETIGRQFDLAIQPGSMMVELRIAGSDKGLAIRRLMEQPAMTDSRPVFIGDDLTDEPGFATASQLGGAGILVGPPRRTAARYGLPDSAAVRAWLEGALA